MTWTVLSCVSLLVALSVMLMVARMPASRRRVEGDRLAWAIVLVFFAAMFAQTRAQADEGLLPPMEELAVQAEAEPADSALAVIEAEATEAEVTEAGDLPNLSELPLSPGSDDSKPPQSPSGSKRIVELPADFAAPDKPISIPDRPEWVDREPQMIEDQYFIAVSSALHVQQRDCRRTLDERMVEAVSNYVEELVGSNNVDYFLHYDAAEIRKRFVSPDTEFSDIVEVSVGPMHQSHVLLQFSPEFRAEVESKWAQIRQTGRVVRTAGASVGVLALLMLMFGYFRLDSATKGYYTRRLQMVFVVAILALIAIGVIYFRSTAELIYRITM